MSRRYTSRRGPSPRPYFLTSSCARRLRVEALEDRRMLAAVAVGNSLDVLNGDTSSIANLIANDGGDGVSLREAIVAANSTAGADTITFDAGVFTGGVASVIRLAEGELTVTESVHLDGAGLGVVITADAAGDDTLVPGTFITDLDNTAESERDDNLGRVLEVTAPGGDVVTLTGLTLTGGDTIGNGVGGGVSSFNADLVLTSSTVSGNQGFRGGGIFTGFGAVTLTSSTVSGNLSSGSGGGIQTLSGDVTLTSSTVSGNQTGGAGDGGGIDSGGEVVITSSTVVGNSAGERGGGIFVSNAPVEIRNSIVAGNTDSSGAPDLRPAPGQALTVEFSLIGDNTGSGLSEAQTPDANGNLIGSAAGSGPVDPLLGPLQDNGGPTQTHALLPSSPALDAGDSAKSFDQRGQTRPINLRPHPMAQETVRTSARSRRRRRRAW